VSPAEVLERAPDAADSVAPRNLVPRETSAPEVLQETVDEWPAAEDVVLQEPTSAELEPAPPLRKDQILKLEALTAIWTREVRVGGPGPDDTLLYASPRTLPPPPPSRNVPREEPAELEPAPVPDAAEVEERSEELLELEAEEETGRPPEPAAVPDPAQQPAPAGPPRRVSDWTSRHDPRSLEFPIRQRLERAVPLADVSLDAGPVLDQGAAPPLDLRTASACTGMAAATAANVLYLGPNRGDARAGYGPLREDDARALYFRAQQLDHVHGESYAGTSVLAVMKAGQEAGLWPAYLWALGGTKDIAQVLLQLKLAVVIGVPWSADLERPDAAGVIRPGGADLGGHSLAVVGLRLQVAGRPGPFFELQQSRGTSEGSGGRVFLHHSQLRTLLAGRGEAAVPLPAELL
jgi:hypothetical protein